MTLEEWEALPTTERDAICAERVMRWRCSGDTDVDGYLWRKGWLDGAGLVVKWASDWSPTTDRNATALLLDEVMKRGKRYAFDYELGCRNDEVYHAIRSGVGHRGSVLEILRLDPSLIAYCCCVVCEEADDAS